MLVSLGAACVFSVKPAFADTATAEALFEEGRKLAQSGNFEQACPKFEESLRLQPGMGTEFNLADCQEHLGKTASAWGHYRSVLATAKLAGQAAREKVAQERLSRLEPGLCHMIIEVPNGVGTTGMTIERDGTPVGEGQWSTAVPVDPGEHRVTAKAPGKVPFNRVLNVSSCAKAAVVTVPLLADDQAPRSSRPSGGGSVPEPQTRTVSNGVRTPLIVTGLVLSAVGVGVGVGYGAASLSSKNASAPYCNDKNVCTEPGTTYRKDALRYGDLATVGLVTASVFAVATIVVVVLVPTTKTVTAQNLLSGTIAF